MSIIFDTNEHLHVITYYIKNISQFSIFQFFQYFLSSCKTEHLHLKYDIFRLDFIYCSYILAAILISEIVVVKLLFSSFQSWKRFTLIPQFTSMRNEKYFDLALNNWFFFRFFFFKISKVYDPCMKIKPLKISCQIFVLLLWNLEDAQGVYNSVQSNTLYLSMRDRLPKPDDA